MKAFIRLKGEIRPKKQQPAISYEQSEMSRQAVSYQPSILPSLSSAISNQLPVLGNLRSIKYPASNIAYYLRPFLLLILVLVSCAAVLAQESVVHTTPAAQAELTDNKVIVHETTPLKIGDKIPDELWEMYFPVVSEHSDQLQYLSLGDFKNKAILLEFYGTANAMMISSPYDLCGMKKGLNDVFLGYVINQSEDALREAFDDLGHCIPIIMDGDLLRNFFTDKPGAFRVLIDQNEFQGIVDDYGLRKA